MSTPDDPYAGQPAPEHGSEPEQPATPPPGQPPYYAQQPAPHYYAPPAPKPPSRLAWFSFGAASMLALGLVSLIVLGVIFSIIFDDELAELDAGDYESGYVYYVDQKSVVDAVEVPCNRMMAAGDAIQLFTTPAKAAVSIEAFAVEAEGIADAIDGANPDSHSKLWRDDWNKLAHDLETYATDLKEDGNDAFLNTFTELGEAPIMVRMLDSSEANCEIPSVIFAMDTDNADYYME